MESATMPKILRGTTLGLLAMAAGAALYGCKQYDVKYQPFNPRAMQEPERTAASGATMRPRRALPTTLETEFPIEGDTSQPTTGSTTQPTTASVDRPPATGPAIGAEEPL